MKGGGIPRTTTTVVDLDLSNRPTGTTRDHDSQRKGKGHVPGYAEKRQHSSTGRVGRFGSPGWLGRADPRTTHSSAVHALSSPSFPSLDPSPRPSLDQPPRIVHRSLFPGSFRFLLFLFNLSFRTRIGSVLSLSTIPFVSRRIDVQAANHVTLVSSVAREAKHDRTNEKEGRKRRERERAASTHARGNRKVDAKDTPGNVEGGRTRTKETTKEEREKKKRGIVRPEAGIRDDPRGTNRNETKQATLGDVNSTRRNQNFRP